MEQHSTASHYASHHLQPDAAKAPMFEDDAQYVLAHQIFQRFEKSIKSISLYRNQRELLERFVEPTAHALQQFHDAYGPLTIKINPFDFFFGEESVLHDESRDNNIPYKFYREGFRTLTFEPGFDSGAMIDFIDAILRVPRDLDETDLTTLLWQAQIPHFSYLLIDGFDADQEEQDNAEIDDIIEFLKQQLQSDGPDSVNFKGLSEEDLDIDQVMANAETQRGLRIKAVPLNQSEQEALQSLLDYEKKQYARKSRAMLLDLFQKSLDPTHLDQIVSFIGPQLEALLQQQEFTALNQFLDALHEQTSQLSPVLQELWLQLLREILRRLAHPDFLEALFSRLNQTPGPDAHEQQEILGFLGHLGPLCVPTLRERLGEISGRSRRLLLQFLLTTRFKRPQLPRVMEMYSHDQTLLNDILQMGKRHPGVFDLSSLRVFVEHPHTPFQVEGLRLMSKQYPGQAAGHAAVLLHSKQSQVFRDAVEVLVSTGRQGLRELMKFVDEPAFAKKDENLQRFVYRSLGKSQAPAVFEWLEQSLQQKSGLFRSRVDKQKELTLRGLLATEHPEAIALLKHSLREGKHSKLIRQGIEQAIQSLTQLTARHNSRGGEG